MKRRHILCVTAVLVAGLTPGRVLSKEEAFEPWTLTFATDVRYFSWRSDRSFPPESADATYRGRGSQVYTPFAVQLAAQFGTFNVEVLGRGGWVHARQTSGDRAGEIKTFTDSQVSTTFTFKGAPGFQPFASVALNLPTGTSRLTAAEANARMDPDLVELASFGEGLNIGPTVGVNIPILTNLIATFSVGYTRRGEFRRDGALDPLQNPEAASSLLQPGNVTTATASLGYQSGAFTSTLTLAASNEAATRVDHQPVLRAGDRFVLSAAAAYAWPDTWGATTLTLSAARAERNKVLFVVPPTFALEPFNGNSNIYRAGLEHLAPIGASLWAGPTGSFLYRDRNGYDAQTLQFVPAKRRYSAGLMARYQIREGAILNARFERIWINQGRGYPDAPYSVLTQSLIPIAGVPHVSSSGWQGVIGANLTF